MCVLLLAFVCAACLQEASEDVRTLARLWQLQAKMHTVDGGEGSTYEARIERVAAVAAGIEQRLAKRLELLDGYARVMNMIEIEVEMDMQVGVVGWMRTAGGGGGVLRRPSACTGSVGVIGMPMWLCDDPGGGQTHTVARLL